MTFTLSSPAFQSGGMIPPVHTCEGDDQSPPLQWSGIPAGTRSLALIIDDPDAPDPAAPKRVWVHWVLYNLPSWTEGLEAGIEVFPAGTRVGLNDSQQAAYGGPCPPIGKHRYFHKLYALDVVLPDLGQPTRKELELAMLGHVLAHTELMGTYQKHR